MAKQTRRGAAGSVERLQVSAHFSARIEPPLEAPTVTLRILSLTLVGPVWGEPLVITASPRPTAMPVRDWRALTGVTLDVSDAAVDVQAPRARKKRVDARVTALALDIGERDRDAFDVTARGTLERRGEVAHVTGAGAIEFYGVGVPLALLPRDRRTVQGATAVAARALDLAGLRAAKLDGDEISWLPRRS